MLLAVPLSNLMNFVHIQLAYLTADSVFFFINFFLRQLISAITSSHISHIYIVKVLNLKSVQFSQKFKLLKNIFFFFLEFQFMASALDDNSLLLNQTTNQFWCLQELNPNLLYNYQRLLIELTGTYNY